MTQLELNQKFAEAYNVGHQRYEPIELRMSPNNIVLRKDKFIPIHKDTLTIFQLCIEHNVNVMQNEYQVVCIFNGNNFINEHWYENYKDHATKEAATCAAMWAALCKLKGIE